MDAWNLRVHEGARMTFSAAIAYALEEAPQPDVTPHATLRPGQSRRDASPELVVPGA